MKMEKKGTLLLLPNLLDDSSSHEEYLPPLIRKTVRSLDGLIAESKKGARRFLRRFIASKKAKELPIEYLNEHTQKEELMNFIKPLQRNEKWGLISDAGLPCIADPGAQLVSLAHKLKIPILAYPGPSSIFLALMHSGFCAQRFTFHGYLSRDPKTLRKELYGLEKKSFHEKATQVWIEAPYRSFKMLAIMKKVLNGKTMVCVAKDLTLPTQEVFSQTVTEWRKSSFDLQNHNCVFLLNSE